MRKTALLLLSATAASLVSAGSAIDQFNELSYGTLSGRLQTVSMYRDYDHGNNAYATSMGLVLNYLSPDMEGWMFGATYVGVGVLDSMDYNNTPPGLGPGEYLLANGHNNIFNEAYLSYNMKALNLTNTVVTAGRKVTAGEVFQLNEVRQKPRSISAVQAHSKDVENFSFGGGHSFRMSNWIAAGDRWEFNNYGDVFRYRDANIDYDIGGVTWAETVYTGIENLEIGLYDAIAWNVANLLGLRAEYTLSEDTSLMVYVRSERDIGRYTGHDSTAIGLSAAQKMGSVNVEGGYFGVSGDNMLFEETTTGINHALGSSMMIFANQFNGGAQTLYLKATAKIEKTSTALYGLYNYTWHDTGKAGTTQRWGHELNIVAKQPVPKIDNLTVAFKFGLGLRDGINGRTDDLGTDTRLFMTYTF